MLYIVGILIFLVFVGCAPKFFKWLLLIDVVAFVVYFVGLWLTAVITGATKGGRRSGALVDYAIYAMELLMAAPVIVVVGAVVGLCMAGRKGP